MLQNSLINRTILRYETARFVAKQNKLRYRLLEAGKVKFAKLQPKSRFCNRK